MCGVPGVPWRGRRYQWRTVTTSAGGDCRGTIGQWDHLSVVDAAGGGRREERLRRQAGRGGRGVAAPAAARRDVWAREEEEGKTKRRLIKCWLLVHAFFGWEGVCWEARKTEDGRVASTWGVLRETRGGGGSGSSASNKRIQLVCRNFTSLLVI